MIQWGAIKAAIRASVVELTALPVQQVKWKDEPGGFGVWANAPTIWLRISTVGDVGYPDETRAQPDATSDATVTVSQQKRFTLSIRCESFEQDIANPKHAGVILSSLKTRLRRSSSVFGERASLFSIWQYGDAKWLDYKSDGRQVSCYVLDLICSTIDVDADTTVGAGGWIGEVIGSGTVTEQTAHAETFDADAT